MAGFAKFDGVDGESTDAQHDGWVSFLSLDWGVSQLGGSTGQSRRRGSVVVDDVVLMFEYEQAMPKLLESCLRGRQIPKLEIELTSTSGGARATYLRYELKNVMVSSYSVSAAGDHESGPPKVSLSINFEEIKVTYTKFDAAGGVVGTVETDYARERLSSRSQAAAPATATKKYKSKKYKGKKRKK